MKALVLCQHLNVGGAEELILGMTRQLPAVGVEPGVVAISRRGPIAEEIARAGVSVHDLPGQPGPRDPAAFARLVRLLRRERPDVVHTFLLNATLYGRLAAIIARIPVVLAAEQNVYRDKRWRHARFEQLLAAATFRVVACCRTVGDYYARQVGVPRRKIAVVYNAVRFGPEPTGADRTAARTALGLPGHALVLGTLGRLTEQKGHSVLLRAAADLARRFPQLALIVAGEGPLRSRLETEAEQLGIGDRVRFLGLRRDRATLFAAMDAFVLPSRWEGLSLALVEAMGVARPVVATSVGGNPEVVDDGRTGLLVAPNDPTALVGAIETLLADAELARELGAAAAREARARFSIEQHVEQLGALYRQGLTERLGGRAARVAAGP